MITIIAHRGLWTTEKQQNTTDALIRASHFGFGIEIDIWQRNGNLVISHNEPTINSQQAKPILYSVNTPMALNLKCSIDVELLKSTLKNTDNYFLFDSAVPDSIKYIKAGLNVYTRDSEYEEKPAFYKEAIGVWMDMFNINWITEAIIKEHLSNNKKVCIVSPELHGRDHKWFWEELKSWNLDVQLCTDYPFEAREFFKNE